MSWEGLAIMAVLWAAFMLHTISTVLFNARHAQNILRRGLPSEVPEVDHSQLEALTRQLQDLGFVFLGDVVSVQQPDPNGPYRGSLETRSKGLGRVMAHPIYGCYATLISAYSRTASTKGSMTPPQTRIAPFRTAIVSLSREGEEAWAYGTHNREVDPFALLIRNPRGPGHRMLGASVDQLFESHLSERDSIERKAGVTWDPIPAMEKWEAYEARTARHIKSVHERASTLRVAWLLISYKFTKHERWMGELAESKV